MFYDICLQTIMKIKGQVFAGEIDPSLRYYQLKKCICAFVWVKQLQLGDRISLLMIYNGCPPTKLGHRLVIDMTVELFVLVFNVFDNKTIQCWSGVVTFYFSVNCC